MLKAHAIVHQKYMDFVHMLYFKKYRDYSHDEIAKEAFTLFRQEASTIYSWLCCLQMVSLQYISSFREIVKSTAPSTDDGDSRQQ